MQILRELHENDDEIQSMIGNYLELRIDVRTFNMQIINEMKL